MGRPRKDDRRDRQVNIHLTQEEYVSVASRASAAGITPAEYGRMRLLHDGKEFGAPAVIAGVTEADRLLHLQLRRLGNLLNQLVRHLHQTGELLPDATTVLQDIRAILIGRGQP